MVNVSLEKIWHDWNDSIIFSGVFCVSNEDGVLFEKSQGFRNKSEN